jgi:hypothetical protein
MSDRERTLWQAISRGLKLITAAIDEYIGKDTPAATGKR